MAVGQLAHELGLLHRHGAEDDPVEAEGQQLLGPLGRAHAAAELHRNRKGRGDRLNHPIVGRFATAGAIEIHKVQAAGPLALPLQGLGHRVIAEAGHLVVIALVQAHALAPQQINGGNDLHGGGSRVAGAILAAGLGGQPGLNSASFGLARCRFW